MPQSPDCCEQMPHARRARSAPRTITLSGAPGSDTEPPPSAELGRGSIDYRPIFEAAKNANIKHAFIEQEQYDKQPLEALKIDAEYMKALTV